MATKQTSTQIQTPQGHLQKHEVETDLTLLPVVSLERLHHFRPDLVDKAFEMTHAEGVRRRDETSLVNTRLNNREMTGQIFAFVSGVLFVGVGGYLVLNGHDWAGAVIACTGIGGGLALGFITRNGK